MIIANCIFKRPAFLSQQTRTLFHWINQQFNAVDDDRKKLFGPDRVCAEWILRNGGAIKWAGFSEVSSDYNQLPMEGTILRLQEIDASNTSIMDNGFEHLKGCEYITKIILNNCNLLEDNALAELHYVKKTLLFLQISSCHNLTDQGLFHLSVLEKLKQLVMYDLSSVKDKHKVVQVLKSSLPRCNIQYR